LRLTLAWVEVDGQSEHHSNIPVSFAFAASAGRDD
jgi:hypothetical protein